MECTIKFAIAGLTNYIIARIIYKELVMSSIGAFSPLQVMICSDFHLRGGRHFAFKFKWLHNHRFNQQMDCAIKSATTELPNYIVARIIHKELLVST